METQWDCCHTENSLKVSDHVSKGRPVTVTLYLQLPHLFLMSAGAEEHKGGFNQGWSFSKVSMTTRKRLGKNKVVNHGVKSKFESDC